MNCSAVLLSGGLDSAVLLADEASRQQAVQPIYVTTGLAWETAERTLIAALLASDPMRSGVRPLVSLGVDMQDVFDTKHWAITGHAPGYHTPDEDVYLPGRNIILLGKAGVYCAAAGIDRLVLGTLRHNPFPDATPDFRSAMQRALTLGLGETVGIDAPFAELGKADVVRRGATLGVPFDLTLSCMNPRGTEHCGSCSKCRERHDAFVEAGIADPTVYVNTANVRAS